MSARHQVRTHQLAKVETARANGSQELGIGVTLLGALLATRFEIAAPPTSFFSGPWGYVVCFLTLAFLADRLPELLRGCLPSHPPAVNASPEVKLYSALIGVAVAALLASICLPLRSNPAALGILSFLPVYAWFFASASPWKWLTVTALALGSITLPFLPNPLLTYFVPAQLLRYRELFGSWLLAVLWVGGVLAVSGLTTFVLAFTPERTGRPSTF